MHKYKLWWSLSVGLQEQENCWLRCLSAHSKPAFFSCLLVSSSEIFHTCGSAKEFKTLNTEGYAHFFQHLLLTDQVNRIAALKHSTDLSGEESLGQWTRGETVYLAWCHSSVRGLTLQDRGAQIKHKPGQKDEKQVRRIMKLNVGVGEKNTGRKRIKGSHNWSAAFQNKRKVVPVFSLKTCIFDP